MALWQQGQVLNVFTFFLAVRVAFGVFSIELHGDLFRQEDHGARNAFVGGKHQSLRRDFCPKNGLKLGFGHVFI
jgi:hypothetical protein